MTSTKKTEEPELLLKTDRLGRVRMPREKREQILDGFESSGMSGQAFAARIGVKYPTFASWVQKRRRARGQYANADREPVKAPFTLIEAVVQTEENPSGPGASLEVETATGLKVRLNASVEIPVAVQLLKALRDAEL